MNVAQQQSLKKKIQSIQGICAKAVKDLQGVVKKTAPQIDQATSDELAEAVGLVERTRKELGSALSSTYW